MEDWWEDHLEMYRQDGREDADKGVFDWPHYFVDNDPQNEDENFAYKEGFDKRRKELGSLFRWAGFEEGDEELLDEIEKDNA